MREAPTLIVERGSSHATRQTTAATIAGMHRSRVVPDTFRAKTGGPLESICLIVLGSQSKGARNLCAGSFQVREPAGAQKHAHNLPAHDPETYGGSSGAALEPQNYPGKKFW